MECIKFEGNAYCTEPRTPSLAARLAPSLVFYASMIRTVLRAGRNAKRGQYDTKDWCESSRSILRALEKAGVRFEIEGIDNFRTLDGPCVFIGNHMSTLETFVLPSVIAPIRDVTFVVKQSLVDYPVFKYVMRSRDPITVGRSNPRDDLKAVLEGGAERLKAGTSIIIFPQTTRTPVLDRSQFNTIGVKLAKRACVPAVPIALKTDAWGTGKLIKDFGRIDRAKTVHMAFGKPLAITDRGSEEHQQIIDFIEGKLKKWEKE